MAYLCARCEAVDHPHLRKTQVQDIAADVNNGTRREVLTVVGYCEECSSNTVHVSDGGGLLAGD